MLQLSEATAQAILDVDEHWDGGGNRCHLKGDEISLLGRICCLAQSVEVFVATYGVNSACDMAQKRRGKWFDPKLVDVLLSLRTDEAFWIRLENSDLMSEIALWEPSDATLLADEQGVDRIAEAFARVVDAKSPWTYLHSTRVAEIAVGIADQFDCSSGMLQDIRRAGLLHDIGKLGVSNMILDKAGKPTEEEFAQIRKHPEYSQMIIQRVPAFDELAYVAGAHHERLDGRGYHRGLAAEKITFATRILTVADICEALTAKRPYRDAMEWERVQRILTNDSGSAVDAECVGALTQWYERYQLASRVDDQLECVERLVSEL